MRPRARQSSRTCRSAGRVPRADTSVSSSASVPTSNSVRSTCRAWPEANVHGGRGGGAGRGMPLLCPLWSSTSHRAVGAVAGCAVARRGGTHLGHMGGQRQDVPNGVRCGRDVQVASADGAREEDSVLGRAQDGAADRFAARVEAPLVRDSDHAMRMPPCRLGRLQTTYREAVRELPV